MGLSIIVIVHLQYGLNNQTSLIARWRSELYEIWGGQYFCRAIFEKDGIPTMSRTDEKQRLAHILNLVTKEEKLTQNHRILELENNYLYAPK